MKAMMGLVIGVAAGVAAGLLAAPMRGSEMRSSLRSRADHAADRAMMLLEEGRRAFRRGTAPDMAAPGATPLTASLGEIAGTHSGATPGKIEA